MANPSETVSYRTRWASQSHSELVVDVKQDLEQQLISDQISEGWIIQEKSESILIFSTRLQDGRKWTREYDRKTCRFICQRFHQIEQAAKALDWPTGTFGE